MTLYARLMTYSLISGIVLTVPIWPPMLTVMTGQMKHTRRYFRTIRKGFTHLHALIKMRAIHRYFSGEGNKPQQQAAQNIGGFCNRCGQCCLERRCMFLEKQSDAEYLCGIYGTWLRARTPIAAPIRSTKPISIFTTARPTSSFSRKFRYADPVTSVNCGCYLK